MRSTFRHAAVTCSRTNRILSERVTRPWSSCNRSRYQIYKGMRNHTFNGWQRDQVAILTDIENGGGVPLLFQWDRRTGVVLVLNKRSRRRMGLVDGRSRRRGRGSETSVLLGRCSRRRRRWRCRIHDTQTNRYVWCYTRAVWRIN